MKDAGGRIYAVSVDPPEQSRRVMEKHHLAFPILSDESREVIRAYGLVHAHGSPDGKDIAVPAHLLIDGSGNIVWRHLPSASRTARPPPKTWPRLPN